MAKELYKDGKEKKKFDLQEVIFEKLKNKFEYGLSLSEYNRLAAIRFSLKKSEAKSLLKELKSKHPISMKHKKLSLEVVA